MKILFPNFRKMGVVGVLKNKPLSFPGTFKTNLHENTPFAIIPNYPFAPHNPTDIMNNKPQAAWDLYASLPPSSPYSSPLLSLLANETYRRGQFWTSLKAFDLLEAANPLAEHWEGKRGACAGLLQLIMMRDENP